MFRRLPKRADLRPTGHSGIQQLPVGWHEARLGALGSFVKGRGGSRQDDDPAGVACIRYGDLYKLDKPHIHVPKTRIAPAVADNYTRISRGDILFALSGESQLDIGKSAVCLVDEPTHCGGDTAVLSLLEGVLPEFLAHALTAPYATEQTGKYARGDIIVHLSVNALKQLVVVVPTVNEQSAIVHYLAHAHARIDGAIDAKRKLIALLEEQMKSGIHQAVTRGLDPAAPLRDSGIPWIGQIPSHWKIMRAKYVFKEFDVRSGTGVERLLSLRAAAGLVFHDEVSDRHIGPEVLTNYKEVRPGHLVMNRMRAATGLFAISSTHGLVSPDYSTMEVSKVVDARFYLRLFKTRAAMTEFRQQSTGLGTGESGFMRLYSEAFGRIPMPIPPLDEQNEISDELARLEHGANEIAMRVNREIELLSEFRTRLTSDVVTGQIDVRVIAESLPEVAEQPLASAPEGQLVDDDLIESELNWAGTDD